MAAASRSCLVCSYMGILLFLGITTINSETLSANNTCITPNNGVGSCVKVNTCTAVINYIRENSPLVPDDKQKLQKYQCGQFENQVKVCCPEDPRELGTSQADSNVKHRNVHLLPTDCGRYPNPDIIFNGNKSDLLEFSWMALLSYETEKGQEFRCTGTVINELYILTSAACITNLGSSKLIGVRVGDQNISSEIDCEDNFYQEHWCAPPFQDIGIAELIPHPQYNSTSLTDNIGLIRVASRIVFDPDAVNPICLPPLTQDIDRNVGDKNVIVTGWGLSQIHQKHEIILKISLLVQDQQTCQKSYDNSNFQITFKHICTSPRHIYDNCVMDNGGPLKKVVLREDCTVYVQVGVVSLLPVHCESIEFPAIFTRIEYYMDWILDNLKP